MPRWRRFSPAREHCCFRHLTAALLDFVRRSIGAAGAFSKSGDSSNGLPGTTATQHTNGGARVGKHATSMDDGASSQDARSRVRCGRRRVGSYLSGPGNQSRRAFDGRSSRTKARAVRTRTPWPSSWRILPVRAANDKRPRAASPAGSAAVCVRPAIPLPPLPSKYW